MKPEPKFEQIPSEDVFDDEDMAALPAILEGLADIEAGRVYSADEVEQRLKERFQGR